MNKAKATHFVNARNLGMIEKALPHIFVARKVTASEYAVDRFRWKDNQWILMETVRDVTVE